MRLLLTIIFSLLLLIGISCNEPETVNEIITQEPSICRKVVDPIIRNKTNPPGSNELLSFLGLPIDKELFYTVLYGLILLFSCLYCRQTGKQRTTLEENLLILSRKIGFRHRLALYLLSWLQRSRQINKRSKRSRKK